MPRLFPISPEREARLVEAMSGCPEGEDANAWASRMNSVLTESDRQWIIDFKEAKRALDAEKLQSQTQ